MRAIAFVILVAYFCSACFTYVPAASAPTATGQSVRVYLSQPQTVDLEEVSAGNITRVDGEIASAENGELVVSAWGLYSGSGAEYDAQGRSVRLPREAIERVERKEFSWLQSAGLVALGVAAGLIFAVAEDQFSGGGGPGRPPTTGK